MSVLFRDVWLLDGSMEKACRAELLAPKIGQLQYLNPALCVVEHTVYLASYSQHEKEASDELR